MKGNNVIYKEKQPNKVQFCNSVLKALDEHNEVLIRTEGNKLAIVGLDRTFHASCYFEELKEQ